MCEGQISDNEYGDSELGHSQEQRSKVFIGKFHKKWENDIGEEDASQLDSLTFSCDSCHSFSIRHWFTSLDAYLYKTLMYRLKHIMNWMRFYWRPFPVI